MCKLILLSLLLTTNSNDFFLMLWIICVCLFQTLSKTLEKYQDKVDALRNTGGEIERRVSQRDRELVEERLK